MAENKRILISIDVKESGTKATSKAVREATKDYSKLTEEQKQQEIQLAKNRIASQLAKQEIDLMAASQLKAAGAFRKGRTQAGLNNAILLETGRLASDASFGFTAIANNLSQLVSLFGSFAQTNGGVVKSFKELGKSIMGTGGVLLAVQLLISAFQSKRVAEFVDSLNGVSEAMKALRKAASDATDVFGKQIGKLTTLTKLLEDNRITQKQRSVVLKELKRDHKDLNVELDEEARLTDESRRAIERKIEVLKLQAETQAIIIAIQEETVKQLKAENSSAADNISFFESLILLTKNFGNVNKAAIDGVKKGEKDRQEAISDSQEIIDKLYERLTQVVNFEDKDRTSGRGKARFREFRQQLLDLSALQLQFEKQAAQLQQTTAQEQLDIDEEFAKKDADRRLKVFKERQALRLEEYKEQVKDKKNANQLIANAELEFQESIVDAENKHKNVLLSIEDAFITKRILLKDKEAQAIGKIERSMENAEIERLRYSLDANQTYYSKKEVQVLSDIDVTQDQIKNAELYGLSEVELFQKRQELFNLTNSLIDINLKKEIDAINEKTRINQEYVGFAQGISQLMNTLADENEALQKAALIIEKGAAIADVVIRTQASNQAIRAGYAATAAIKSIDPTALARYSALATAQITRNNIGAGISIANILATTLMSFKKPSTDGGGGGGVSVEAPDFNVVGASPESQLAQTVAGQQSKPLKAFVVGKEITSQQELDRNITTNASLGD